MRDAGVEDQRVISDRSFSHMAAIAAIASLPLAMGNLFAMLATVHFDLNGMTNPLVLLHAGAGAAPLWRWSMILDIFGYYLPIVPLILLLHGTLRHRGPNWIDLFALCLLAYCLIGAIGGAILATAVPTLIREYATTSSGHHLSLQSVFTGYTDGIYRGLWNLLEEFLAGIGWIGFGLALRSERRRPRRGHRRARRGVSRGLARYGVGHRRRCIFWPDGLSRPRADLGLLDGHRPPPDSLTRGQS